MRILLAGPDFEENLSIRYLAGSLLAAGHDTILAAFNTADDIAPVAEQALDADIVGLSLCFQSRAQEFLEVARRIKSRDPKKLIVAGGHYASCAAEPLLQNHPEIDVIVIHEGERTLVEMVEAAANLEEGLPKIPGIGYRDGQRVLFTAPRATLDDLDALPFPDRRGPVHTIAGVPTSYMMGSRGCYGRCAYCCITTLHQLAPGKRFRQRSMERIADEMAALYLERGTRQFIFHDDNFLVPSEKFNHTRISAFEKALESRGVEDIALVIKCRPADANRKVLRRLKDLGLVRVFLGVESATEQGLSSLERVQSVDDSVRALEACADLDISAQFTIMTFNPDATLETLRSDVKFMRRFSGNPLNFCRAEIYAGTPLEKGMILLGRARGNYLAREYDLADPVAQRACDLALDLFYTRCWGTGSLMQKTIGLDHTAAVRKRFDRGPEGASLCRRVGSWVRSVNLDTISLLEEVLELSASYAGRRDAGWQRALLDLREREVATRDVFLSEGARLLEELDAFRLASPAHELKPLPAPRFRFARQAAAAVLAFGIPAATGCIGVSEMAAPPLQAPPPAPQNSCSLTVSVTDQTGAVLNTAKITLTNLGAGQTFQVKPSESGHYVASNLPAGRYSVKAEAKGFKTAVIEKVELKAGEAGKADIRMEIGGDWGGCCEYAAVRLQELPLAARPPQSLQNLCSLAGTVTDPSGAVIPKATITITNVDTGLTRTVTTNELGQYVAGGLPIGHYTLKAQAQGFSTTEKTGIVLQPAENGRADVALLIRVDITLEVSASYYGISEYAAAPLKAPQENYIEKKKPFTYHVGDAKDDGTLQGIAKLVYGDSKMWVQIFEANRDVLDKPGELSYGTPITIPPFKRRVPKLIYKVAPAYPAAALKDHVTGDVVMDVTLREDGAVAQVTVIDGDLLLLEAATTAIKQWRYKPLLVNGQPVLRFLVVVSFGKGGKVR